MQKFRIFAYKMAPTLSYLCGMAATVFVAVSLAIAAVRWFHMCRPYDRNHRYYYPGRPFVSGIYLNALVLLPYAFCPDCPDMWYLARLYFLPVTIYHFALMLYAYFGNVMKWKQWRRPMLMVSIPIGMALLAAFVLAVIPGNQVGTMFPTLSVCILYALGLVSTGVCIAALCLVLRWARQFNEDDYSNPADFPVTSTRRWTVMVIVNVILCWTGTLSGSRAVMAVLMVIFAFCSVLFIISALHPQRTRPVEIGEADAAGEEAPKRGPSKRKQQELLQAVKAVVVEQEAYLDAHLTIQDVADRCGYSRSMLSGLFKAEFGGFFSYINRLRLQHVDAYLQEHPDASLQEAALESGFNSRQAYYSVKSKI